MENETVAKDSLINIDLLGPPLGSLVAIILF